MTESGIINILSMMKLNWSNFLNDCDERIFNSCVKLYNVQFKDFTDEQVLSAVSYLISTYELKTAPNIAIIKHTIANKNVKCLSDSEVWDQVYKAVKNSSYHALEQWTNLDDGIKKSITPDTLREMATQSDESMKFYRKDVLDAYHKANQKQKQEYLVGSLEERKLLEQ